MRERKKDRNIKGRERERQREREREREREGGKKERGRDIKTDRGGT